MRKSAVQISLWDIYNGVSEAIEQHIAMMARATRIIVFLSMPALYHETIGRVSHIVRFLHCV